MRVWERIVLCASVVVASVVAPGMAYAVGIVSGPNDPYVTFRNSDGDWTIYKSCVKTSTTSGDGGVGPAYVAKFVTNKGFTAVNGVGTGTEPGEIAQPLDGGLGLFGYQEHRGGDPRTGDNTWNISNRACGADRNGFGVSSWSTPSFGISAGTGYYDQDVTYSDGWTYDGGAGQTLRVRYRWRFDNSDARLYTMVVQECPLGVCGTNPPGKAYLKAPMFANNVNGRFSSTRPTHVSTFDDRGRWIGSDNKNVGKLCKDLAGHTSSNCVDAGYSCSWDPLDSTNPHQTTGKCYYDQRLRTRFDYGDGSIGGGCNTTSQECFNVVARAYPVRSLDVQPNWGATNWEGTGQGLDQWAVTANGYDAENPKDSCKTQGKFVSSVSDQLLRDWEYAAFMSGASMTSMDVMNKAWDNGTGLLDCGAWFRTFGARDEAHGSYFSYSINDGWRTGGGSSTSKSAVDLVFAIDTTGSMSSYISSVKSSAQAIAAQLFSSADARVALVDYKDLFEGCSSDGYASRVDLPFTSDASAFDSALSGLFASGGCDTPESVYSGLTTAVGLPWRSGVKKAIILMGDAPPHDPEPVTGLTEASVTAAADAVDPAVIYTVNIGGGGSPYFEALASDTGGQTYQASDPLSVVDAITSAITSIVSLTADAGGPYTGTTGTAVTFDASASTSDAGNIVSYEWDFDGDAVYDLTTSDSTVEHTYTDAYSGVVNLRITTDDDSPLTASASAHVDIVAGPGSGGTITCNGSFSGSARNVEVPAGRSCSLRGAMIEHDVIVREGGALTATGTTIGHDLVAESPLSVRLGPGADRVSVGHDLEITGANGVATFVRICAADVGHDVRVADVSSAGGIDIGDNEACSGKLTAENVIGHDVSVIANAAQFVNVGNNQIGHDLLLLSNSSWLYNSVSDNGVGHDALCFGNVPPVSRQGLDDGPNIALHANTCG